MCVCERETEKESGRQKDRRGGEKKKEGESQSKMAMEMNYDGNTYIHKCMSISTAERKCIAMATESICRTYQQNRPAQNRENKERGKKSSQ